MYRGRIIITHGKVHRYGAGPRPHPNLPTTLSLTINPFPSLHLLHLIDRSQPFYAQRQDSCDLFAVIHGASIAFPICPSTTQSIANHPAKSLHNLICGPTERLVKRQLLDIPRGALIVDRKLPSLQSTNPNPRPQLPRPNPAQRPSAPNASQHQPPFLMPKGCHPAWHIPTQEPWPPIMVMP